MSTIKELAETCGVSEQAIRKWCARNQVSKDIAKHYIIDRATETAILRHYGKDLCPNKIKLILGGKLGL